MPGAATRVFLGLTLAACLVHPLAAMEWPDARAKMRHNFGWNDDGTPTLGLSFAAEGVFRAADSGEVLFSRRQYDPATVLPSPLGAWTALDHGEGLISVYGRFQDADRHPDASIVEKGALLGTSGVSGMARERGFYFSLFDLRERRWINPIMIINQGPDTKMPLIRSAALLSGDGTRINPAQTRSLPQGTYRILVDSVDAVDQTDSLIAPYRILCYLNGLEQGTLYLETLTARNGVLKAQRAQSTPAAQVYRADRTFDIGEGSFKRGRTIMEVLARDAAGNERSVTFTFNVE